MWEERSCRQVRQWQHWGSGCYSYHCREGQLHIVVANYTYTCFFPGQEISVRIVSNGWLRKGAIRCPPCRELCEEQFQAVGQSCKLAEEPLPTGYPRDELDCGAASNTALLLMSIVFSSIAASARYLYT